MIDQHDLDDMRQGMLEDLRHEQNMKDPEYFLDYIAEHLYFDKPAHLYDVCQKIHEECMKADNDVTASDVFEYMKDIL